MLECAIIIILNIVMFGIIVICVKCRVAVLLNLFVLILGFNIVVGQCFIFLLIICKLMLNFNQV